MVETIVRHVEEPSGGVVKFSGLLVETLAVVGPTQPVKHQRQTWQRGQKHFALGEIALEKFVLNIRVNGHARRFCQNADCAESVGKPRLETQITGTFVFGALLRLDIQVNAVEAFRGVSAVELKDFPDVSEQRVAVLARFVGVSAGQQGLDSNIGSMEQRNEMDQRALVRRLGSRGHRNVDFVNSLRSAEIPQILGAAWRFQHRRTLPP